MKKFILIFSVLLCLLFVACKETKSPSNPGTNNGSDSGSETGTTNPSTKYESGVPTNPPELTFPDDFPEVTLPYLEFEDEYHEQGSFGPAPTEDSASDGDQPVSSPSSGNSGDDHGTDDLPLDEWD